RKDLWPKALASSVPPWVLYKMHAPLATGALWNEVSKRLADRLVVIVHADDLRAAGLKISRRRSWERTAMEFALAMASSSQPAIRSLAACRDLLVRFDLDGVIHYQSALNGRPSRSTLYFDPLSSEGGFAEQFQGTMTGFGG